MDEAFTWTSDNHDSGRYMASLRHNELIHTICSKSGSIGCWINVGLSLDQRQIWLLACQKRASTKNYIPQILWDVITCPYPCNLFMARESSYMVQQDVIAMSTQRCYVICPQFIGHSFFFRIDNGLASNQSGMLSRRATLGLLSNNNNNNNNSNRWAEWAFVLRWWRPHDEERHAAYDYASRQGLAYCVAFSAVLNFGYFGECSHWGNRGRVA